MLITFTHSPLEAAQYYHSLMSPLGHLGGGNEGGTLTFPTRTIHNVALHAYFNHAGDDCGGSGGRLN